MADAPMDADQRRPVLVVVYPNFADFQLLPCLFLLRDHALITTAGAYRSPVKSECELTTLPDTTWDELLSPEFALVLVPGAPDMRAACESPRLLALLQRCAANGAVIGATSGGALVLHFAGLLKGHSYTTSVAREGCRELGLDMTRYRDAPVVTDRELVTAKGYAALEFGEAVARRLGLDVTRRIDYLRKGSA